MPLKWGWQGRIARPDASPLVRAMAVWALGRLAPAQRAKLAVQYDTESDSDVRTEWARDDALAEVAE